MEKAAEIAIKSAPASVSCVTRAQRRREEMKIVKLETQECVPYTKMQQEVKNSERIYRETSSSASKLLK
jgi:hypothetical protein